MGDMRGTVHALELLVAGARCLDALHGRAGRILERLQHGAQSRLRFRMAGTGVVA